jgi:predicted phage-related endonuclease
MTREFTIIDCKQRTDAWFSARCGRVTGSKAAIVQMGVKTDGYRDYALQLALERMTAIIEPEPFFNKEMKRGVEKEPWGREIIEIDYGVMIRQTGFCRHDKLMIGMSFDGDVNDFESFIEVKMPKTKTHINYMRAGVLPGEYRAQVMHGHLVSGAKHSIFCSGDDRLPAGLDRFYVESRADDLPIYEYQKSLEKFLDFVSITEAELRLLQKGIL